MFDALSIYLKRRGALDLKYWHGSATVKHHHFKDLGMVNKPGPDRKLVFEDELLLVLVKLKTGLNNQRLSCMFGVSATLVSSIFSTLINFMARELKILFEMPVIQEPVADCFQKYRGLRSVIDCTEIQSEKGKNLQARKEMYSNYKSKETVKFMIGMGPSLCVNYVSKAFGGRASDKHIVLSSTTFLEGLPIGSMVMADRGFNIEKELERLGIKLLIPVFKGKDRTQMTKQELELSESIARARIHVERIIQRIRTFEILETPMKTLSQDVLEQMFTVCAYLVNFQQPIIR